MRRQLSLLLALGVVLGACGPTATATPTRDAGREAILAFTRQALQIEGERAELMDFFAKLAVRYQGGAVGHIVVRYFLRGARAGLDGGAVPSHDLAGMSSLHPRLLLLDAPQSMQAIKDSLLYLYDAEIQLYYGMARADAVGKGLLYLIDVEVTKDNLEYWEQIAAAAAPGRDRDYHEQRTGSAWAQLQAFRRDVYLRWARLLRDHGIDPAKEGFTALLLQ